MNNNSHDKSHNSLNAIYAYKIKCFVCPDSYFQDTSKKIDKSPFFRNPTVLIVLSFSKDYKYRAELCGI